jgi:hypothetical protein
MPQGELVKFSPNSAEGTHISQLKAKVKLINTQKFLYFVFSSFFLSLSTTSSILSEVENWYIV